MLDRWLLDHLVCPRDKLPLMVRSGKFECPKAHRYHVTAGVPIMLLDEVKQTHDVATLSLAQARGEINLTDGLSNIENGIDPVVQRTIAATHGMMYRTLINQLREYPIPVLRPSPNGGNYFLDVGCNWGRWCIAASKAGYTPIGIDPSLDAILAAKRVTTQFGIETPFVVADIRYLPFMEYSFDIVFSYSVLQHFHKEDARAALKEIKRVLKIGGVSVNQMANVFGARCIYHQLKRGFRMPHAFEVRYWTPSELAATFTELIGPSELSVGGFFSLTAQSFEAKYLPIRYRMVIQVSELLCRLAKIAPGVKHLADSLYVTSSKT